MEWISVEDRLPENGEPVIVLAKDESGGKQLHAAYRETGIWGYTWLGLFDNNYIGDTFNGVSHWMPLPELPELPEDDL